MKTRYFLQSADYGQGVEVRICQVNHDSDIVAEALPLAFAEFKNGSMWREPVMTMDKDAAQNLLDELWQLGYRPERGNITTGQIAATEKHLNDMRAIVGKLANVEFPK
jgi:hypothetical protein